MPGKIVDLTAVTAPSRAAAAEYYPAIYWFSMLRIPGTGEFPGTGDKGNGMPTTMKTQDHWLAGIKTDGCVSCHQLGNKATRTVEPGTRPVRFVGRGLDATYTVRAGEFHHGQQYRTVGHNTRPEAVRRLDRSHSGRRIAVRPTDTAAGAGAQYRGQRLGLVGAAPITSTTRSQPTSAIRPSTPTGRSSARPIDTDFAPVLDPVKNTAAAIKVPVRDPKTSSSKDDPMYAASSYWGDERIWDSQTSPHNPR